MPDTLKLHCTCPACGSSKQFGGQLELYGVTLSETPLQLDQPQLFHKWLANGRWPAARLIELADLLEKEWDWFRCASCGHLFPISLADAYTIKLLARQHGDPEWAKALDTVTGLTR